MLRGIVSGFFYFYEKPASALSSALFYSSKLNNHFSDQLDIFFRRVEISQQICLLFDAEFS